MLKEGTWQSISQFLSLKIRRLTNFMRFSNVDWRIIWSWNCNVRSGKACVRGFSFFSSYRGGGGSKSHSLHKSIGSISFLEIVPPFLSIQHHASTCVLCFSSKDRKTAENPLFFSILFLTFMPIPRSYLIAFSQEALLLSWSREAKIVGSGQKLFLRVCKKKARRGKQNV